MSSDRDDHLDEGAADRSDDSPATCLTPADFALLANAADSESAATTERLRSHLDSCARCRSEYDRWKQEEALAGQLREAAAEREGLTNSDDTVPNSPSAEGAPDFPKIKGYRILRVVGRGGMGIVYEAVQVSLGRPVALKVLPALVGAASPDAVTRFRREAVSAGKLHHNNIVPIYDFGADKHAHFCAMELIDGRSLDFLIPRLRALFDAGAATIEFAELLDATNGKSDIVAGNDAPVETPSRSSGSSGSSAIGRGSVYFRQVASWIADVADALDYAHHEGVIHRDIKPSNLILARSGRIMITDFGLARDATDQSVTRTGALLGTLRYMSPEQAMAKRMPLDHRTDVYSLGATLYELLAFQAPFMEENDKELLGAIVTKEPRPPRKLIRSVPKDLETICLKALEKSPDSRYHSAKELADDLRRFSDSLPIAARRPSLAARAIKLVKRRKAVSVAVVATTLLVGALVRLEVNRYRAIKALDERCKWCASEGAYERVVKCVGELLAEKPSQHIQVKNLYRRAWAQKELYNAAKHKDGGLLERAQDDITESLKLTQDDPGLWNMRGVLFKMQHRYDKALDAFHQCLRMRRTPAALVNVASMDILAVHDIAQAVRDLRDAIGEFSANCPEDFKSADGASDKNRSLAYALGEAWRNLASIQWAQKDQAAGQSICRAIELAKCGEHAHDYGSFLIKARILLTTGGSTSEISEAIATAEHQAGSDKALVHMMRARARLESEEYEVALEEAGRALDWQDSRCYDQLIIACAEAAMGDIKEACAALAAADQAWPAGITAPGDYVASAEDGILWFDTYEELTALKARATGLLQAASKSSSALSDRPGR